jgi:hypothetical protein
LVCLWGDRLARRMPVSGKITAARVTARRQAATLLAVGVLFGVLDPSEGQSPAGGLGDLLAGRVAPETEEFGKTRLTRKELGDWLERARTWRRVEDRGVAIANLQNCAWVLLGVAGAKPAALELLNLWVMPNASLLRSMPRTSACSWENVVLGAYACYKQAGDAAGERRVLELLTTQARDSGMRDLATLRLAGLTAREGNLRGAMDIARRSDQRGEFGRSRAKLLKVWEQQLREQKRAR